MIRSTRIPSVLNRICDEKIQSALLVTTDGELLGASSTVKVDESFGTLTADIAMDYQRLGEEFGKSHMQSLLLFMDLGIVGVTETLDCLVICIADPDAPTGLIKAKLQAAALYVHESLTTMAESS